MINVKEGKINLLDIKKSKFNLFIGCYVFSGFFIWAATWLEVYIPATMLILYLLLGAISKSNMNYNQRSHLSFQSKKIMLLINKSIVRNYTILIWSLILTGLVGFFPFTNFTGDWIAGRWELYLFLVNSDWPSVSDPAIVIEGSSGFIRHYLGFYLPPAALTKFLVYFFDFSNVKLISFVIIYFWITLGIFICLKYVQSRIQVTKSEINLEITKIIFIFFCFSGLDIIGAILTKGYFVDGFIHIEWWAQYFNYLSPFTTLSYPTNHFLATIFALVLLDNLRKQHSINRFLLFLPPLVFWSPLVTLAILPYFLFIVFEQRLIQSFWINVKNIRGLFEQIIIFIIILFQIVVIAIYFTSQPSGLKFNFFFIDSYQKIVMYLFFVVLEFGIIVFLVIRNFPQFKSLFYLIFVNLMLIPFVNAGIANDFSTRMSLPALFILSLIIAINNRNIKFPIKIYLYISSLVLLIELTSRITYFNDIQSGESSNKSFTKGYAQLSGFPCLNGDFCETSGTVFANSVFSNQMWAYKEGVFFNHFLRNKNQDNQKFFNSIFLDINSNRIESNFNDKWVWLTEKESEIIIRFNNKQSRLYTFEVTSSVPKCLNSQKNSIEITRNNYTVLQNEKNTIKFSVSAFSGDIVKIRSSESSKSCEVKGESRSFLMIINSIGISFDNQETFLL